MRKLQTAVIFGGQSCEHEVSINSACSILNELERSKHDVHPIYIDHQGKWWLFSDKNGVTAADFSLLNQDSNANRCQPCFLPAMPNAKLIVNPLSKNAEQIAIDVIFPIVHGSNGEDGILQGLLELVNLPYVGSDVAGSAVAMDKVIMKAIFASNGIATADFIATNADEWQHDRDAVLLRSQTLQLPLFVKPSNMGSSVGIRKVSEFNQLAEAIDYAFHFDSKVLIEQGVSPARELELAVLGNDDVRVSQAGEIIPPDGFYDYKSKYISDDARLIFPAEVEPKTLEALQGLARKAFHALGLSGMARVDFLLDSVTNKPYVLEVNTLPGFTAISMYPKLWTINNLAYPELLNTLLDLAIAKHAEKTRRQTDFTAELAKLQQS
jgi:D-alanine-D-alanine ligase